MSAGVASLAGVQGALSGILVLELCGDEPSGTLGTQILADLGASVLKIERPPQSDLAPTVPPKDGKARPDIAYMFGLNRNKRSMCLDLKDQAGLEVFKQLVRSSDVVYDNYKPGVMRRLGLDADALRRLRPDIIACSVSGFGQSGPWSQLPAYDATIQALGGGMSITGTGEEGSPPVRWGNPIGGIGGALYAVVGILAALRRRRMTSQGTAVDIALLDAQIAMNSYRVPPAAAGAQFATTPRRGGSGALPYGPFKAGDGRWFVLGITKQFWATAAKVLGHPEWAEDDRFRNEEDRQANEQELNRLVGEAMLTRSADEWQKHFVDAGIPGAKVLTIPEAFSHPHVALRNMLVGFDHPMGRNLKVAGDPIKMSAHPFLGFRHAPGLGADTQVILRDILKLEAGEVQSLRERRVVWWPPLGEVYDRPSVV
jgi:crotonobetainyl-CoA:carnitine CoA-transferase CaiB-like acyl-CoA transferase